MNNENLCHIYIKPDLYNVIDIMNKLRCLYTGEPNGKDITEMAIKIQEEVTILIDKIYNE